LSRPGVAITVKARKRSIDGYHLQLTATGSGSPVTQTFWSRSPRKRDHFPGTRSTERLASPCLSWWWPPEIPHPPLPSIPRSLRTATQARRAVH